MIESGASVVERRRRRAGGENGMEGGHRRRRRRDPISAATVRHLPGGGREDRLRRHIVIAQRHACHSHAHNTHTADDCRQQPKTCVRFHTRRVARADANQTGSGHFNQPPPIPPIPPAPPSPGSAVGCPTGPLTGGGATLLPPWVVWLGPGPLKSPPDPPAGAPPPPPPPAGAPPPPPPVSPPDPAPPPAGGAMGAVDSVVVVDVVVDVEVDVLVEVLEVLESPEPASLPQAGRARTGRHSSAAERRTNVVMLQARTRAHRR